MSLELLCNASFDIKTQGIRSTIVRDWRMSIVSQSVTLLRRRAIVGAAVIAVALLSFAAGADEKPPSVVVNPATIEGRTVSSADPIFLQVQLKAGSQDLTDIVLSTFSNDGITTTAEGGASAATVARIPATAEHVWKLRLVPSNGKALAPAALSVNVTLAFKEGKEKQVQRYLLQTIKIAAPAAHALAEIDIKGSLQVLSHERAGQLFVVVTNKHSRALQVTDVRINEPKYVRVVGPGVKQSLDPMTARVPYGETRVFAYEVTAPDQIVPAKYPVIVVVSVETADGLVGSVTKSQDIEVAVLGESELLGKLGAPSLLFLPGVLFLLAWQLLWSQGKAAQERQTYTVTPTNSVFWLIAVVLSIIMAFLYPWIVLYVLGQKRDYLIAYGLRDYLYVFALAIMLACLIFLLWRFARWGVEKIKAAQMLKTTPSENDAPLTILQKLGRRQQRTALRKAHLVNGNAAQYVLVLEAWCEPELLWVAPPIRLQETDLVPPEELNFVQRIENGEVTDALELAQHLKGGIGKWWTLEWQTVGTVSGPTKRPASEWTTLQEVAQLVQTR